MEATELSTELVGQRFDSAQTGELVAKAEALTIASNDDYSKACEFEKGLRALDKKIVDHHATRKRMADQLHKRLVAEEREDRAPIQLALNVIRPKRIEWEEEQERLRKEEEERQREAHRKADEDKRLAEAEKLEAAGQAQEAERVLEREEPTTRIHVASNLPKSGIAKRWYWGFDEKKSDLKALVKAAAADDRYLPYLDFHRVRIRKQIESLKDMFRIPGLKAWSERR